MALAEYSGDMNMLCSSLNMNNYFSIGCNKIVSLGKRKNVEPGVQSDRYSFQIVDNLYIICMTHLPSRIYSGSEDARRIVIQQMIKDLEEQEKKIKSSCSILIGDFNEDPFGKECIAADHLHGIPCIDDAMRSNRIIQGKSFNMFYNPMWNFFGDFEKPPGTYYFSNSNVDCTYWHIYDQVMVRPCLSKQFISDSLEIVTHTSTTELIDKKGHPNKEYSDHLPIIFEIKEEIS